MNQTLRIAFYFVLIVAALSCTQESNKYNPGTLTVKQSFHSNGNKADEMQLNAAGKREGLYKEWFPNGDLQVERIYKNDTIISDKLFTPEGKILKNIVVKNGREYGLLYSSFCLNGVAKSPKKDSLIFTSKN